jgi:parallel beta-helix repeat protein
MKRIVLIIPAVLMVLVLTPNGGSVTALAPSAGSVTAPVLSRVVQCGEVITVDTRVGNDLACKAPVALEIGADGVDLDLNGHTIEARVPPLYEEGVGLFIAGYDDVSVENGTIIGGPTLGFALEASEAERLSLSRLSTNGYASLYVSGDEARIVDVTAQGFSSRIASSGATIKGLTTDTELDVYGQGVEVTGGHFGNLTLLHVDNSSVHHNLFTTYEMGLSGNGNSIVRNQADQMFLAGGSGNTVWGNRTHGVWLNLGFSGNLLRDNVVFGGLAYPERDGIFVDAGATDNMLVNNSASGTADDGIDVEDPSTTLARNRAFGNGDFGIEAVAGVIDGGGNRAWNNGNPLQCLNVDCRPSSVTTSPPPSLRAEAQWGRNGEVLPPRDASGISRSGSRSSG